MSTVNADFWRDRRVLLTGHTGFKGAWLSLWLQTLGARVTGFSAGVPTDPSLFELARVGEGMTSIAGDIGDHGEVLAVVERSAPEVVIHMAAQSLVRRSLIEPLETYRTNVMGTVNLLDAVRVVGEGARAVLVVTSDKCYENDGSGRAHGEQDPLGGDDPYSSSKGCAELVTGAFRDSFFSRPGGARIASARAGNVIGGGDWAEDRLMPDIMRAALAGEPLLVRNPDFVRPWQHVLDPLAGYLTLLQALWDSDAYAGAWNFGPSEQEARSVGWVVQRTCELWPEPIEWSTPGEPSTQEAASLRIDSARARARLGWRPLLGLDGAIDATVSWYERLASGAEMRAVTVAQIEAAQRASAPLAPAPYGVAVPSPAATSRRT